MALRFVAKKIGSHWGVWDEQKEAFASMGLGESSRECAEWTAEALEIEDTYPNAWDWTSISEELKLQSAIRELMPGYYNSEG